MSVEEAMKDRKLTSHQVLRRLVFIRRAGWTLTVMGMFLLLVSMMLIAG